MTIAILIGIIVLQVFIIVPLAYDDGMKRGEHREYRRSRKEIQEILENV